MGNTMHKRIFLFSALIIGFTQRVFAGELDVSAATALLFQYVNAVNIEMVQDCLARGADINARNKNGYTPIMCANNDALYKLLLEYGSDIRIRSPQNNTRLMWVAHESQFTYQQKKRYALIISHATFNPVRTPPELREAQKRTFNILCVFYKICPQLSKDIRNQIFLLSDINIRKDALCSAFSLHKTRYDRVSRQPLQVVRLLVQNNLLDTDKTVATLKAHHFECLKLLMLEAIPTVNSPSLLPLLDPTNLEQNFGQTIEENIKKRLGLAVEEKKEERKTGCQIQ